MERALLEEYERFGPWIDEVRTADDVPRLFRDQPMDLDGARLVLKVPRNLPRRDVTPGMDLYDHLLVLTTDRLTVLTRRPVGGRDSVGSASTVEVLDVPVSRLAAVHDVVNLLDGRLTLHTDDGTAVQVRYNGSARASVGRLVDALRAAVALREPSATGRALIDAGRSGWDERQLDACQDDLALVADYRELARANSALEPWACHGRVRVAPRPGGAAGAVRAVAHALVRATLQGAVVAGDATALEVVGRHAWLVRGSKPVHSSSRLVVPLAGLAGVAVDEHLGYAGAVIVRLEVGAPVELVLPAGSPTHRLLVAAAAAARLRRRGRLT